MDDNTPPNRKSFIERLVFILLAFFVISLIRGYFKSPEMTPDEKIRAYLNSDPQSRATIKQAVDRFEVERGAQDSEKVKKIMEKLEAESASNKAPK